MTLPEIRADLRTAADSKKAVVLQRFFKTGKDEYAEGDIFLGVIVPKQRKIAKKYNHLTLENLDKLIKSKIHEERLTCLFILIDKYKKSTDEEKKKIYDFYLSNLKHINNWDLIDLSAPSIMGAFLEDKDRQILYDLAKSDNLWGKRVAMLSCYFFIKQNEFKDALKISKTLINDKHDLIHKAVGWMLREIGKRDLPILENFLKKHYKSIPRTMLRYAIEKFSDRKRKRYLKDGG